MRKTSEGMDISDYVRETSYFSIHQTFRGKEAEELIKQSYKFGPNVYNNSSIEEGLVDYNKDGFLGKSQDVFDYFEEGKRKYQNHVPAPETGLDSVVGSYSDNVKGDSETCSGSSNYFVDAFKNYAASDHAKELKSYLTGKGRQFYDLEGVTTSTLKEGAVAGVAIAGDKAALVGDYDFEFKVNALASKYGVSRDVAERYVFDHESVHLSQKGKNYSELDAEYDVENTLNAFYSSMALKDSNNSEMYKSLAKLASARSSEVSVNYGSGSSYSSAA